MKSIDVLVLHRIKGIGNKKQLALIKCYKDKRLNSLEELLEFALNQTATLKKAVELLKEFFANNLYLPTKEECENDLAKWRSAGITVVAFGSVDYPIQLESLDDRGIDLSLPLGLDAGLGSDRRPRWLRRTVK